jgi:hypothetical protein
MNILNHLANRIYNKFKQKEKTKITFKKIFTNNSWNSQESVSGTGSEMNQTATLRKKLENLLKELEIDSILDIPCGDFNWMRAVDLSGISYTGADIVDELIEQNNCLHALENSRKFFVLDIIKDTLPKNDLIFTRDCFVHLPNKEIYRAIQNIRKSESKYLLTTTFTNFHENFDIDVGKWRPINLQLPPFNLPEPLNIINEDCTEDDGKYTDKSMALWKIDSL